MSSTAPIGSPSKQSTLLKFFGANNKATPKKSNKNSNNTTINNNTLLPIASPSNTLEEKDKKKRRKKNVKNASQKRNIADIISVSSSSSTEEEPLLFAPLLLTSTNTTTITTTEEEVAVAVNNDDDLNSSNLLSATDDDMVMSDSNNNTTTTSMICTTTNVVDNNNIDINNTTISSPSTKKRETTKRATTTDGNTTISSSSSLQEIDQSIQQLTSEILQLKPTSIHKDHELLISDKSIKKLLKEFKEFCKTDKDFISNNRNEFPTKFTILLIAYCQGQSIPSIDELIEEIIKEWTITSNSENSTIIPEEKKTKKDKKKDKKKKDNFINIARDELPTKDAMKNAISLNLELKSYGVKDICELDIWEARKLTSLKSKLTNETKEQITTHKELRTNFKKVVDSKSKEIAKLTKKRAKLVKELEKKEQKLLKATMKEANTSKDRNINEKNILNSPRKNVTKIDSAAAMCKPITLFTKKAKILEDDKTVSAPVCRVSESKSMNEIDEMIKGQDYKVDLKESINHLKERRNKKQVMKRRFKLISLFGQVSVFDKEKCQSTCVNGRKPLNKDPKVNYEEEDDKVDYNNMEELMDDDFLPGEEEPEDGESLEDLNDEEELEFDEEDDVMMDDGVVADNIIEYEDGKIEKVDDTVVRQLREQKKKKKGGNGGMPKEYELETVFEYTNQLQDVKFDVDVDQFKLENMICVEAFWWMDFSKFNAFNNQSSVSEKNVTNDSIATTSSNNIVVNSGNNNNGKFKFTMDPLCSSFTINTMDANNNNNTSNNVTTTSSNNNEEKVDEWDNDTMNGFIEILDKHTTKASIINAMHEKYPSISKNRVSKKLKDSVVKEKRKGDACSKYYVKDCKKASTTTTKQ